MPTLKDLFGPQLERYRESLSLTAQRQSVLAQNLANIDTPGYRRKDLEFDLVFNKELKGLKRIKVLRQMVEGGNGPNRPSAGAGAGPVDLEREVMAIAECQLRYQAIADFASGHISSLKTVIREGR